MAGVPRRDADHRPPGRVARPVRPADRSAGAGDAYASARGRTRHGRAQRRDHRGPARLRDVGDRRAAHAGPHLRHRPDVDPVHEAGPNGLPGRRMRGDASLAQHRVRRGAADRRAGPLQRAGHRRGRGGYAGAARVRTRRSQQLVGTGSAGCAAREGSDRCVAGAHCDAARARRANMERRSLAPGSAGCRGVDRARRCQAWPITTRRDSFSRPACCPPPETRRRRAGVSVRSPCCRSRAGNRSRARRARR